MPGGVKDKNIQPVDKEDKVQLSPPGDLIKGTIKIILVHAKGLLKKDFTIIDKTGLSDPYVIIGYPDNKEDKSRVICNTINPCWN